LRDASLIMREASAKNLPMPISIPSEFPLTEKCCYLNTAGMGLVPSSAVEATRDLYSRHLSAIPYPDLFNELGEIVEKSRPVVAKWIGARPGEVSFQPNASTSQNFVVSMVGAAKGENIVIDDLGFPSGTFPTISQGARGVEVRWVKNRDGLITAQDYEGVINRKTKLVIVSLVSWVNGLRADVEEVTKIAHERDALCLVDSTHGTGYIDIDADGWGLDFLASSNYKWLLSTHGSSEFFCASRHIGRFNPPHLGWHTAGETNVLSAERLEVADTVRKFEPGNPDYISIFTLVQSLSSMARYGRRKITAQTLKLSKMVNLGLRDLGLDVLTPSDDAHASGITFASARKVSGDVLEKRLRKLKVFVTARSYHGRSGIRVSPYFYNDEHDISAFLDAVKKIVR